MYGCFPDRRRRQIHRPHVNIAHYRNLAVRKLGKTAHHLKATATVALGVENTVSNLRTIG